MKQLYEFQDNLLVQVQEWTPRTFLEAFHWHTSLEIGYCLSGTGRFYFGDKCYRAGPGDVFIVNNMERHIAQSDEHDPSKYLFVYFDPSIFGQTDLELLLPFVYNHNQAKHRISADASVTKQIGELVIAMYKEQQERKKGYKRMMQSLLLQICILLFRYCEDASSIDEKKRVLALYNKLQPALQYMQEQFREPIGLQDIAKLLNLSVSRTRHLFVETLGEGFKENLLHIRINEAKRLLIGTDMLITDVCTQCGFQSMTPFYRAFQQIVGMTPQDYRRSSSVLALFRNISDDNSETVG